MSTLELHRERAQTLAANATTLIASARDECVHFLHCELKVAHTFLDLAKTASKDKDRDRRLGRAAEAAVTVERYLTGFEQPLKLRDEERERLSRDLSELRARMASSR